jgi:hypothetical protein
VDLDYESRTDVARIEVHNCGTHGNHPSHHAHGLLQVPNVFLGEDYLTKLWYPLAECDPPKSRDKMLDELVAAAQQAGFGNDLKSKFKQILGWK